MANPKNELQEIFQKRGLDLPDYKTLGESGPAHCRSFKVQVTVCLDGQELVERAEGSTKRAGEKEAAKKMLSNSKVKEMLDVSVPLDSSPSRKNKLQEFLQKMKWPMPEYSPVRLSTLTSEFTFKCVVRNSRGDLFAEEYGHGSNKKEAEKDAAANMLPRVEEIFKKRETSPQLQCPSYRCSNAEVSTPSKTPSYEFSSRTSEPSGATAMDGSVVDISPSSKNKLQEILQKRKWPMPEYPQVSRTNTSSEFTVKCVVRIPGGEVAAEEYGHGSNKKEAEKDAATNVLPRVEEIFRERETSPQLQNEESKFSHVDEGYVIGKFENQYMVQEKLGKGGFAVVYHMRKKFDRADYAVKIIRLRRSKSSREKVLREVRALAQLDHNRIVRYFDAWMETAPVGWRDKEPWSTLKYSRSLAEQSHYPPVTDVSYSVTSTATASSSADNWTRSSASDDQQESSDSVVDFQISNGTSGTPTFKRKRFREELEAPGAIFLFIQTQLCQKKTLRHWLDDNSSLQQRSKKTILRFFEQILDAVCHIHQKKLIHRDLKPSNIFFSLEDGSIKVGDFGLVTGELGDIPDPHSLAPPGQQRPSLRSPAGTGYYMSPEQSSGKYDEKVDMFALGVIYVELNSPFSTKMERDQVLTAAKNHTIHPTCAFTNNEVTLIMSLLAQEPSKRPSAEELYIGPLLKQLHEESSSD